MRSIRFYPIKKLCIAWCCLCGLTVFAQITEISDKPLDVAAYLVNLNNPKYDRIEGSPYLYPGFRPAKINGSKETKFVRFNVVENNIEVKQSVDAVMMLSKTNQYDISLLDGSAKVYQTFPYINEKNETETTFFELIYKGDSYSLYLKERIKLIPGLNKAQAYADKKADRFQKVDDHFYVSNFKAGTNGLTFIPNKKKEFYKIFELRSREIQQFIKDEKLSIDEVNDLIAILNYYWSLQKG